VALIIVVIVVFFKNTMELYAQSSDLENSTSSGFIDFNEYYDSRNYSEATINSLASIPNSRFYYFSLTNSTEQEQNSDLSGFYSEQNMLYRKDSMQINWVSEHQVGLRLINQLYLISEFRINEYVQESTGIGFGFEYKLLF